MHVTFPKKFMNLNKRMSPVILLRLFSSISFHFAVHSLHLCTLIPADKLEV